MHFCDDTDRDGKQNKDVDGCTAYNVVEVDGGHEVSFQGLRPWQFLRCGCSAFGLPSKQEPHSNIGRSSYE